MTENEFQKRYVYNIEHMYGKRGSMKVHKSMNCMQIISQTPSAIDTHGCPYRSFDQVNLRKELQARGISANDIETIIQEAQLNHFQVACQKELKSRFKEKDIEDTIVHPNGYAALACNLLNVNNEPPEKKQKLDKNK